MATHRFALSAGHRNENRGGAHREIDWTYPVTKKLQKAIQEAGGEAWIIQEEDGDRDPTFSVGRGLQNAARLCVDLDKAVGGVDAYISMHYEGGPARGFFGIFPDARSGADQGQYNPLDKQLIRDIANEVAKTGMPKRTAGVVEPGMMSERQTGVGAQGYRLGEFVGTIGFRDRVARVILEAGNYGTPADRDMIWRESWQDAYVAAIVEGLQVTFGRFDGSSKPTPAPTPKPEAKYESAAPIAGLADRPIVFLDNDSVLVRVNAQVTAKVDTKRLKYASKSSGEVGTVIPAGSEFVVDYLIINPDGSQYWYTPWATRVAFEDTHKIEELSNSGDN